MRPVGLLVLIQLTFGAWPKVQAAWQKKQSQIAADRSLEYKAEWKVLVACCVSECLEDFPAGVETTVGIWAPDQA